MINNLYAFDKPNFERARIAAYKLLISQPARSLGMKAKDIIIPGKKLVFSTIQDFACTTGTSMSDLTVNGKITLGYHVNLSDKIYLLLHNSDIISESCENWTNIHEIGHICLGHNKNGDREEVEAHFFAACFLMPDPVIRCLEYNGCCVDKRILTRCFNVSPESAEKKLNTMSKGQFETPLDKIVEIALLNEISCILENVSEARWNLINNKALGL